MGNSSLLSALSPLATVGASAIVANGAAKSHVTSLRDYQHANKIFTPNHSQLAPKTKNWFHIYFDLDPTAITAVQNIRVNSNPQIEWITNKTKRNATLAVLVKSVSLPNFKFDVKAHNQYNRWSIGTTKINYQPVNISFWDDTLDVIRGFWFAYYQYMIQDPKYITWQSQEQTSQIASQMSPSTGNVSSLYSSEDQWGSFYGLDTNTQPTGYPSSSSNTGTTSNQFLRNAPFFRSIRIYQFNRAFNPNEFQVSNTNGVEILSQPAVNFTEYVLVNPIISAFDHDNVDFSTSEFMTNKMTVEYETVMYNSGFINSPDDIASWDAVQSTYFDNTPSPLTNFNSGKQGSQLSTVLTDILAVGQEVTALAAGTGQATTSTFLNQAVLSASSINSIANNPSGSPIVVAPSIVTGYGTGGAPPTTNK